jgi:RHS repeat-associated protein
MRTEGYPNGMLATYTYNAAGTPVAIEYQKTTHCTEEEKEKCKWFTDSVIPTPHGEWGKQTSTFGIEKYTFDEAGRLTRVQDTPTGKDCTTRNYIYDEDGDRTGLLTQEPGGASECPSEGEDILEAHTYDSADRLTDTGTEYNTFGDITSLPAADAGNSTLTSKYYVDNQVQSETQGEQTVGYNLDPAGRARETVDTGPKTSDTISHYMGPDDTPAWTESKPAGETERNIPGINGQLAAIQYDTEVPVLQLENLHGDIVATASLSETATELASKANTSEFGVPTTSLPPKYSWLGAIELPTELPSGVISMGARSYIPQLGRFIQPDAVPGGSANAYSYTFDNPLNADDPTGAYTEAIDEADIQYAGKEAGVSAEARAAEIQAAEEAAARAAAEQAARRAQEAAELAAGPQYAAAEEEGWWYEEGWYEEESGYEYASDQHNGENSKEEAHIEPAVLYQPLPGESTEVSEAESGGAVMVPVLGRPHCKSCKKHRPAPRQGEGQELCGAIGGFIGGAIGAAVGSWPGAVVGGDGGGKEGEKICHE